MIVTNRRPTRADIAAIYSAPLLELIARAGEVHGAHHDPSEVQVCVLLSVKTGGCPEDCAYCPQAARYHTAVEAEPLMEVEAVLAAARRAKEDGATRFCMGAAWREVKDNGQFDRVLEMVRSVKDLGGLEVCCTLGMLSGDQARRLKAAGLDAYNHNLDTSPEHYGDIISTRTYEDRLETLAHVQEAGISACCGGIVGMGESNEDRIGLLHALTRLAEPPESVPINALVPVEGTPLADRPRVSLWEMIRMIATARILFPRAMVRLSAGRVHLSEVEQAMCFLAGANSIFAGEKLLTTPNNDGDADRLMFERLGLRPRAAGGFLGRVVGSLREPTTLVRLAESARVSPRVVVTGIGLLTGLGQSADSTWSGIRAGSSAAQFLDEVPYLNFPTYPGTHRHIGFPLGQSDHRPIQQPIKVLAEAKEDAGLRWDIDRWHLEDGQLDPNRAGVVLGFGKGDLRTLASLHRVSVEEGLSEARPGDWARSNFMANMASTVWNFRGPSLAPVAACATGVVAVVQGAELIRRGVCDIVLAGGMDATLEPIVLAAFRNMGVLARGSDVSDPTRLVRPWDRDRSGFLVGEGAAVLVLEREDHAHKRNVPRIYAEVAGGALGADAYHMTNLNPDPSNLAGLITRALQSSGVAPSAVDYVNLHGTATKSNDPLECRALRMAFGAHAESLSCSANKAQIGHLLGGAGAAELAITCLAIRDGFVPPTLNLDDPDPACDLDATPHVGNSRPIRAAVKLSLGFGGHLAVAVLRRYEG